MSSYPTTTNKNAKRRETGREPRGEAALTSAGPAGDEYARACGLRAGLEVRSAVGTTRGFEEAGLALRALAVLASVLGTHLWLLAVLEVLQHSYDGLGREVLLCRTQTGESR